MNSPTVTPPNLPDGFYRVSGRPNGTAFWLVKTHRDAIVDSGRPYVCAWGLSLWGPDGEEPTWAYRTFGSLLSELLRLYPDSKWTPDRDRAPERMARLELRRASGVTE